MPITYEYEDALYVNLTNKCNCNCCNRIPSFQYKHYRNNTTGCHSTINRKIGKIKYFKC